ncbi:MAG: transposase [Dissulfurispiraceae bacterium]
MGRLPGCTSSKSKKRRRLDSKRARQRHHFIHTLTRSIVRDAKARGVSAIIVGDLRTCVRVRMVRQRTGAHLVIRTFTNGHINSSSARSGTSQR